ncbi:MAG: hypothetical protein LBH40_04320 [Alphaproteobacteria bacterium]|jgi:hypothetical protein|nr:hypothetical protein [Alphaproteobacteria bacterium]
MQIKKILLNIIFLLSVNVFSSSLLFAASETTDTKNDNLRVLSGKQILITIENSLSFTVDLYDNDTANDLLSQLPLTVTADDYPGYDEKIMKLAKPLSIKNAPEGDTPRFPELGYYQPGQWLAVYYGHIGYFIGKVPLGKVNTTNNALSLIPNNTKITIELVK